MPVGLKGVQSGASADRISDGLSRPRLPLERHPCWPSVSPSDRRIIAMKVETHSSESRIFCAAFVMQSRALKQRHLLSSELPRRKAIRILYRIRFDQASSLTN
jgi:DUF1365 family protein